MLLFLRICAIVSLLLLSAILLFIGAISGASFFGEQPTSSEETASKLFAFASLCSLVLIFVLVKFRESVQILLVCIVAYMTVLLASTLAGSHFINNSQELTQYSIWERWLAFSGIGIPLYVQILFTVALLAPIPLLTLHKDD